LWAEEHLALPPRALSNAGFIPTEVGGSMGYFGPWAVLAISLLLGFAFGWIDRWLRRGVDPGRILVGLGLLYCVLDYEGSWDTYTITFRDIAVLLVAAWGFQSVRAVVERDGRRPVGAGLRVPEGRYAIKGSTRSTGESES
jgi:hypothetical protein